VRKEDQQQTKKKKEKKKEKKTRKRRRKKKSKISYVVDVNVVSAKPLETSIHGLHDMLPGEPPCIGCHPHVCPDLRRNDQVIPLFASHPPAKNSFGLAKSVHVSSVKEESATPGVFIHELD